MAEAHRQAVQDAHHAAAAQIMALHEDVDGVNGGVPHIQVPFLLCTS